MTFARSAPLKPGVMRAARSRSKSWASLMPRLWIFRICTRPMRSGLPTSTWRSNRPARSSAWSSTSGRLVAAMMITGRDMSVLKPSISASNWLSVCSRSSLPPPMAQPGSPALPDGVDLVDEHDGRRRLAGLLEQVAHPGRSHAHEHLHELRAAALEEGDLRFAGGGLGQQRLAGARRAHQQHALGDAAAQTGELLRSLQELDDLLQLGDGLVRAAHILEGDSHLLRRSPAWPCSSPRRRCRRPASRRRRPPSCR